jgi:hypothetical protein
MAWRMEQRVIMRMSTTEGRGRILELSNMSGFQGQSSIVYAYVSAEKVCIAWGGSNGTVDI